MTCPNCCCCRHRAGQPTGERSASVALAEALCLLEELSRELLRVPDGCGRYALQLARAAREALTRAVLR
jgi:hypothetical protein